MKDLKISYDNENGQRIKAEYDTLMDFIDTIDSEDIIDIPMLDYENVEADFLKIHYCINISTLLKNFITIV